MAWCGICKTSSHNTLSECWTKKKKGRQRKKISLQDKPQWQCPLCQTNDHQSNFHNLHLSSSLKSEPPVALSPQLSRCHCYKYDGKMCVPCAEQEFNKLLKKARDGSLFRRDRQEDQDEEHLGPIDYELLDEGRPVGDFLTRSERIEETEIIRTHKIRGFCRRLPKYESRPQKLRFQHRPILTDEELDALWENLTDEELDALWENDEKD